VELLLYGAESGLDGGEFEFCRLGGGEGAGELGEARHLHGAVEVGEASGGQHSILALGHIRHRLRKDALAAVLPP
jgi:hypothetical protein